MLAGKAVVAWPPARSPLLLAGFVVPGCSEDLEGRYAKTLDDVCADVTRAIGRYSDVATATLKAATLTDDPGRAGERLDGSVRTLSRVFADGASDLRDAKPPSPFASFNEATAAGLSAAGSKLMSAVGTAGDAVALVDAAQETLLAVPAPTPPPDLERRAPSCRA